jgi:cytochrome P450
MGSIAGSFSSKTVYLQPRRCHDRQMISTGAETQTFPLAPDALLPLRTKLNVLREFHTGPAVVRDACGPVAMIKFKPSWLLPPVAVVTSPQGIRDVLGGSDGSVDKNDLVHTETRAWGNNLFNMPHRIWINRRRTIQPLFTKKHVAGFAGHISAAADAVTGNWITGGLVDLDKESRKITLRVLGQSIFGLDLGDRAEDLATPIKRSLRWVTGRVSRPVRAPGWLPTPARRRLRGALADVRSLIDGAISAARCDPDSSAELIKLLLAAVDGETGRPLTDQQIADELFIFIIAGHDTTSTTLTYSLWALGRDPAIQDRVAAEALALGDRELSVTDLAHLPYTVQVIHEALRMCPPAAVGTRSATRDVIVDGQRVPAGSSFMLGIYALHHDPAFWPDPEKFDPERFAAGRSAGRDRWQFLPFGGGPRSCVGQHFAMLEATLGLASIVRKVELTARDDEFPIGLPFTLTAGGPIMATIKKRTPAKSALC